MLSVGGVVRITIDVKQLNAVVGRERSMRICPTGIHPIHPGTSRDDSTCHSGRGSFHVGDSGEHTDSILVRSKIVLITGQPISELGSFDYGENEYISLQ